MAQPPMGNHSPDKTTRRTLALGVALFLFAVYLLVYRGGFHSIDEVSIFAVSESLVKFGRANTDQIAWTQWTTSQAEAQGFFGHDGHVYSKKGLALSLAEAPLYWLGLVLPGLGMLQTVSVLNALVTAASGLILFMFAWRLNYASATVVIIPLIYGLATIAFVYAKYLFSEPLAGFLLLSTAYMLFTYRQEGGLRHVAIAGLAAGGSVLTRANNLFLLPVFGLYLLWIMWATCADPEMTETAGNAPRSTKVIAFIRASMAPVAVFAIAVAVVGVVLLGYNALRSGNPLQTGYDLTLFSPNILLGLYKLLFSPLRGLFIYSPILLLSLPGWWLFRKTHPTEAWLFAGLAGVTIGLFSAWSSGEGLSWGSRFLVPVVPFLVIVLAPLVEKVASGRWQVLGRFTFFALLLVSFLIQILGVTINPWVYLAQLQADFGGEFFLENTAALYDFRFSQIVGQLQVWSRQNSDLAWWQPWGFDWLAFGLSLGLVIIAGWLLWRASTGKRQQPYQGATKDSLLRPYPSAPLPLYILLALAIILTYFLLARYYVTDRQFGPPDDSYSRALAAAENQAGLEDRFVTVDDSHYHVAMNRFKARLPLIGFAQQRWPPPGTALPLLEDALAGHNSWLITIGFQPASVDNAAEQWLTRHAFKASDEWLDEVRLVRYGTASPTNTRPINADLGDEVKLVELHTVETIEAGRVLPVEFIWQPLTQPETDYTVFLQLIGGDGIPVAQHDGLPNGGYTPTSIWQPATQVSDRHGLTLPIDLQPGSYQLIAGLYNPASGERLPVNGHTDFVELGAVTIIPATEAGNQ